MSARSSESTPVAGPAFLDEDFLTDDELASELRRTTVTLRRWRRQRIGPPFIKIGREVFYRRAAVLDWLRRIETQTDLVR